MYKKQEEQPLSDDNTLSAISQRRQIKNMWENFQMYFLLKDCSFPILSVYGLLDLFDIR